jgi:phosphate transport system substrate-binding protein
MPSPILKILAVIAVFTAISHPAAAARNQIRAVGSSTVYPFVTTSAEQFGQAGEFKTPIVESTGTGGGFKLFCSGVGDTTPDLSNASRRIMDSEKELCAKNGVTDIAEIQIGYDGIVFANKKGTAPINLSKKQIFAALARALPDKDGKLIPNTSKNWNDVDPSLPNLPILVYGPPPTSGTRDAFVELVMEKGCEAYDFSKAYPDEKERKKACQNIREDGKYVDSGEDDNVIIQKLASDPAAFGIFGYSYYDNNRAKIQANQIEGVLPDFDSVESGKYSVSRSLYVYVKKQHIGVVPGIAEFIIELTSDASIGKDGYNSAKGLLPLKEADRKSAQAAAKALAAKK